MGWIKTNLPDDLHAKLKHYRDNNGHGSLSESLKACVVKELNRAEEDGERLPTEYDKPEYPTWNNDS